MDTASAVLFSGGLDSAVLLASESRNGAPCSRFTFDPVSPGGCEARRFTAFWPPPLLTVPPAITLSVDMRDVYPPTHWAEGSLRLRHA
jgi:hypothetical protein